MLVRAGVCIICCWQKSRNFENFENTTFLEKKNPLHPLPSVHVAEERVLSSPVPRPQLMSDAFRLWSFGGRPSDIPNFLGLDNPAVIRCQVGSILETPSNCVFVRSGMSDESDQAGLILISRFLRLPYEKFLDELRSSTESCDTSASSAAFFEVRNVLGSAEVKFSTSKTKRISSFIFFISEIWMNVRAHLLVPPHFLVSTTFKKMRWKDEFGKWLPKLPNNDTKHMPEKGEIQPEYGDEQADAERACRTRLARPNSETQTETEKYSFSLFS